MTIPGSLHISIVSYNTCDDLCACLTSIFDSPPNRHYKVTVVDNGSTDGSVIAVHTQFPEVEIVISDGNIGYGRANNLALLDTECEYIAILNSDLVLGIDSLDMCCVYLADHNQCGVVGGALKNSDGSPQMNWAAGELNVKSVANEQLFLAAAYPKSAIFGDYFRTNWTRSDTRSLPQVCGAFMVMRSELFNRLGGFDPDYWMYCEDTDLCARVRRHGFTCDYLHTATAIHGHGASSRGKLRPKIVLEHNVSRCIYLLKFYGRDRAAQGRRIMILGALLRVILWATLGIVKRDADLLTKARGYVKVLYGTRKIRV